MSTVAQRAPVRTEVEPYSAQVLTSYGDIGRLNATAPSLFKERDTTAQPEFFLATLAGGKWAPRVVIVRQEGRILGAVFAKERLLFGFPTGLLYGDSTLNGMVVAEAIHRGRVFLNAIEALVTKPGVRGLRLLLPPGGFEMSALETASVPFDVSQTPIEYHSVLRLPATYESFLENLGRQTRRNFRYYRRLGAETRTFVENVSFEEFQSAAMSLAQQDVIGRNIDGIRRALKIFSQVQRPMLVGLRNNSGEWLSILGGWYESGRAVVFFQMNSDRKYPRASLCLVTRAHLIERLIAEGVRDLVFWAGVGEPLSRYVEPIPALAVYLDAPTFIWRAFRRFLNAQRQRLPRRFLWFTEWVIPPEHHGSLPE